MSSGYGTVELSLEVRRRLEREAEESRRRALEAERRRQEERRKAELEAARRKQRAETQEGWRQRSEAASIHLSQKPREPTSAAEPRAEAGAGELLAAAEDLLVSLESLPSAASSTDLRGLRQFFAAQKREPRPSVEAAKQLLRRLRAVDRENRDWQAACETVLLHSRSLERLATEPRWAADAAALAQEATDLGSRSVAPAAKMRLEDLRGRLGEMERRMAAHGLAGAASRFVEENLAQAMVELGYEPRPIQSSGGALFFATPGREPELVRARISSGAELHLDFVRGVWHDRPLERDRQRLVEKCRAWCQDEQLLLERLEQRGVILRNWQSAPAERLRFETIDAEESAESEDDAASRGEDAPRSRRLDDERS